MKKTQIISMGGGGFSMEPDNPLLDIYFLQQTGKRTPKICFIPTASGDSENYIARFYSAFSKLNCVPSHLSLFKPPTADLESFILGHDAVYVGGGNTRSMLALWREWKLDLILRAALRAGCVLGGISAGAICWFEQGLTDSIPGKLTPLSCLGFLPGSCTPHYDGERERRPALHNLIAAGKMISGVAIDDGAAVHYINSELFKVISSRSKARAYQVRKSSSKIVEKALPVRHLSLNQVHVRPHQNQSGPR
ncbi:MAG TPA: peptidase E [Verrucomicrobiae bacterium]